MAADPQGPSTTRVDQNYGASHSGSGDQHNSWLLPDLRRTPWLVDGESEEWLFEVFVPPANWGKAVDLLHHTGLVALVGPPGSGRQAAARRLLGTVARLDESPIRRPAPPDDADRLPLVDDVAPGGRLLFDLSDGDPEHCRRLLVELADVHHVARQCGASLVVILPEHGNTGAPDDEWRRTAVPLGRPDPIELVTKHLHAFSVPGELPEDPSADFNTLLRRSAPADLARFTWLVSQSPPQEGSARLDERMLAAARSGLEESRVVARWIAQHPDGNQRALLLATAMFAQSPAETVHRAHRLLVEAVELPASETHELAAPDLGTRLDEIGAVLDGAGTTTFSKYGSDEAVRRHFWVHFPGLRTRFVDWIIECGRRNVTGGRPGEPSRIGDLIGRFVDVCVQNGRFDDTLDVARQWADVGQPGNRGVSLASALLLDALDRPEEAHRVRRACYEWARSPTTPSRLARAVVVATERGIAPRQPGQAVVRLHHLLRHGDSAVTEDAAAALSRLAANDPLFQRQILARLGNPALDGLDRPGCRAAFRAVADPERLTTTPSTRVLLDDSTVRRHLVTGWRAVLQRDSPAEHEQALHRWLTVHAEHGHEALLDVLVDACRQDFQLLGSVFGCARRWWAVDPEYRRATLVHLERSIARSRASERETAASTHMTTARTEPNERH